MIQEFLRQQRFAVAGSFKDETKFAYRIYRMLRQQGKVVYPVNPAALDVDGLRSVSSVTDIPEQVDVVVLVTPPAATEKIVRQCHEKGIRRVWMQPGAESVAAIQFCRDNHMDVMHDQCVLIKGEERTV